MNLNIIVCIKQVPASSNVKIDPITGVLIRDGSNVKMNPFDLFALEAAFFINEKRKSHIHTITMGPPSAKSVLQESLYMGADLSTLVTDRKFAGADVLATAYTLSQLIEHIGQYDMVICGKQTTDGDTAQVGPEIAENLGIAHVPYVKEIIEVKEKSVILRSAYDNYDEIVEVKYPVLITIEKDAYIPRLPSFRKKKQVRDSQIKIATFKDLKDQDENNYGLKGSPTQVVEMFSPDKKLESVVLDGDADKLAEDIVSLLKDNQFI